MDKLSNENWISTFSHLEHQVVYQSNRYSEANATFAEPGLAEGSLSLFTAPGMQLRQISLAPERQLVMLDTEEKEALESVFVLAGGIESQFGKSKSQVKFGSRNHGFQYSPGQVAEHVFAPGPFEVFQISFEPEFFTALAQDGETKALDQILSSIVRKQPFIISPSLLELQPRMTVLLQAIRNCTFKGLTRALFIEAKMLELFALQLEHISSQLRPNSQQNWSKADREKLNAVREYLERDFLLPLSLASLCRHFGLNEFKLKKGYKHLFGTTVFGHIHTLRMQKARQLLAAKELTVTEIAELLGYQNVGSFSAEFKKRFGNSPSKF